MQKELAKNQGSQVLVHEFEAVDYEEGYDPYGDEVESDLEEDFNINAMEGVDDRINPTLWGPAESFFRC
jgi:hypothetical protein